MDKMNREIEKCIHFMKEDYQLDISMYEDSFLEKTFKIRMDETLCENGEEYLSYLVNNPGEPLVLLYHLGNSYSEFFRNPLTFTYLEQAVLPLLVEKKKVGKEKEIRIWSAACASGQEAYSLAILCDELIENTSADITCRIFATDINQQEIAQAQRGIYLPASLSKVTLNRVQTYFTRRGENYVISPKVKDYIDFSVFDLLSERVACPSASIYGNFDLVFCSNLLFYYKPEYRQRILDKTDHCLSPGGYLVTGETEREIVRRNSFREVFVNSAIFQRK